MNRVKKLEEVHSSVCIKCKSEPSNSFFLDCCHGGICFDCGSKILLEENPIIRLCLICKRTIT